MPPHSFSDARNRDVKSKHNTQSGTWLQAMCIHTSKKRSKWFVESFGTKQSHKSPYTIPKRPQKKRCGERNKAEMNVSWSKVTSISWWKSSTKRGRSTLTNGWKTQRTHAALSNGTTIVFRISVHTAWTYSLTWHYQISRFFKLCTLIKRLFLI
jgi:hypothetical protein